MRSNSIRLLLVLILDIYVNLSFGLGSDINCLKSIKESLEDPYNYFNTSWDFTNQLEGFICRFTGVECWNPGENRVLNLKLSGMGLKGEFPRGIKYCSSVTSLDLSNNSLTASLPLDISDLLPFITSLDLSSNKFTGKIPPGIGNCSFLNNLKLDHNSLNGNIPSEIRNLHRIITFSVANNQLTGRVPEFSEVGKVVFPAESYANNKGLCGQHLDPCVDESKLDYKWLRYGLLFGYVVSIGPAVTYFMSCHHSRVHAKKIKKNLKLEPTKAKPITWNMEPILNMESILQEDSNEVSSLEKIVTRMSFEELNEATNNFNTTNAIGSGPMGTMYKAMVPNGFFFAIKRVSNSQQFDERIMTELRTLGRLKHRNLVPLIGFSVESDERLLVYKYMSNGNLYDRLHTKKREDKTMGWNLRVKVAIGLAKALAWLHHTCYLRIAHLNISSRCVLLDQNFEPKLSNFTEAVIFNDFSNTNSIIINNDFMESGCMKEDVYSFGVVLLEMIMGEDPSEILNASRNDYYEWVTRVLSYSSGFYDHIDKVLVEQGSNGEIFQFIKLGCDCVQPFSDRRPTMLQVYETIKLIGEKHVTDDHS